MADNININGNLSVGRNATFGGKATVRGKTTFEHDVRIKGWLDADNCKSVNKGVFNTAEALEEAYPSPQKGWYAGVYSETGGAHIQMYLVEDGAWQDAGCEYEGAADYPEKADKVSEATEGNLAALDEEGNLIDSGHNHSDYATSTHTHGSIEKDGTIDTSSATAIKTKDKLIVLEDGKTIIGRDVEFDGTTTGRALTKAGTFEAFLKSHQDISGKADKSQMSVATSDGIQTITLKTGTKAEAYTPDAVNKLLGRAVGEAVRVEFEVPVDGEYDLCSNVFDAEANMLLVVVNGVSYIDPTNVYMESTGSQTVSYVFKDPSNIPNDVFEGLDGLNGKLALHGVHIPSYVRSIGNKAFAGCTEMKKIDCEAITPPTIENGTFYNITMSNVTLTVHKLCYTAYTDGINNWASVGSVNNY